LLACIIPAFLSVRRAPLRAVLALLLSLGPALSIQLLLSLVRNRHLNPRARLLPGAEGRLVEHIRLALGDSYVPALHITPLDQPALGAVAVMHGSGSNKASYSWRLVDVLLGRGLAVLLIDIDGHGDSPRVQSFPGIEQDAVVAVAWLRDRYSWVALSGYSLGGCLAAHAIAQGLKVDALVVNEAPPRLQFDDAAVQREALRLLRPDFWHVLADSSLYHFVRSWGPINIRATISTWALVDQLDLLGSLPRIGTPLLLVYGAADAIVPPAQAEQVRAAKPAHATSHLVPGASHLSLILDAQALAIQADWLEAQFKAQAQAARQVRL
jgi:pimeloyl-ACP methyl ester carboxylesterase